MKTCSVPALVLGLAVGGLAAGGLASCGAPPPPPPAVLTLDIDGGANQNPGASGQGNPVAVQIYQLASTGKFLSTDYYSLTGQEAATLGQDEMGASQQYLVTPGQHLTETIPLKPMVTSVGVAVLFQKINQSTWRLTAPVASSGAQHLTLRINELTASIGP